VRFLLFTLVLFSYFTGFSQHNQIFGRTYAKTLPDKYQIDLDSLRNHLDKSIPPEYRANRLKMIVKQYTDYQSHWISSKIIGGRIYVDWAVMENYVNEVLQNILPPKLKTDKMIRAYITKDGTFNAAMTGSGQLFVNIGVFSNIEVCWFEHDPYWLEEGEEEMDFIQILFRHGLESKICDTVYNLAKLGNLKTVNVER